MSYSVRLVIWPFQYIDRGTKQRAYDSLYDIKFGINNFEPECQNEKNAEISTSESVIVDLLRNNSPYGKLSESEWKIKLYENLCRIADYHKEVLSKHFALDENCTIFKTDSKKLIAANIEKIISEKPPLLDKIDVIWKNEIHDINFPQPLSVHPLKISDNLFTNRCLFNLQTFTIDGHIEHFWVVELKRKRKESDQHIDWEKETMKAISKGEGEHFGF